MNRVDCTPSPPAGSSDLVPQGDCPIETSGRKRILVVDDDLVFQRATSMRLRASGYEVRSAGDGSEAMAALHEGRPDLILLDLNFPPDVGHGGGLAWDGFAILTWLSRTLEAYDVPVIVVTADDVERHRSRCQEAGVVDLFRKPVDYEALIATMRTVLNQEAPAPEPPPRIEHRERVLFVDDESGWRQMAIQTLCEHGCEVVTTETAAGALTEAARIRPDLIVVDLRLERESGLKVMRLLVAAHPSVPVLVYAGMGLPPAAKEELIIQGAFQCLQRRSMEELITAVEMAMARPREDPPAADEATDKASPSLTEAGFESVLIVEDDAELSEALRTFLDSQSFFVTRVPNAAEAMRQLAALDFDLILSDINLPGPSGEDFYREVERVKPELCQRFVFMTGHDADPRTDNFIRGVGAFMLWKPFPLADVLAAAETVRRENRPAGSTPQAGTARRTNRRRQRLT